jgi:tetratricopeptide (TPR) repeat protein
MKTNSSAALLALALILPSLALAQQPAPVASLVAMSGSVQVVRSGTALALYPSFPLVQDDLIVTREGRAVVRFADSTLLRIAPGSRIEVSQTREERSIRLLAGRLWALVAPRQDRQTNFRSGGTIAAVRGTELTVAVEADQTLLSVLEGEVHAESGGSGLTLAGGQSAVAEEGKAPVLSLVARPRDAVRWALYYVPVLYPRRDQPAGAPEWQLRVKESGDAYLAGDLEKALATLAGVVEADVRDPRFFTHRASLQLAVGRVAEAEADIARALDLAAGDSEALALQAIVAVVGDEKDRALELARRAVASGPGSAAARIALSYAQQARFELPGARASLEEAVRLEPDNALAWARLSELHASFGDIDAALAAARRASGLAPNLARARTVLGFAYLTQVNTRDARQVFEKAIQLDPSDPLSRLGFGLARIRDGELAEGIEQLEIAAGLDPGNSLIRSYLGKARYEQKKTGLDEREYDMAKKLDPQDPTPWLYDAISKQTTNRPVAALQDLQRAIELNDNRAVYRSRLLLDSDLAARSASLGRVYSDLHFQSLALVEGWRSLNTDPTNYSAHRLLADSYAALPRHEISRVSELLQSQLLQPINSTPIQPQLAESNLFLISSQGPGALSFNEFNPLFNRDQFNLQASGLAGENETWSGEVIGSGIYRKASVSAGYSRFKSQGFRVNEEQEDEIANAFAQVELGHKTSIQGEIRYRDRQNGDLELNFLENPLKPLINEMTTGTTVRGGLRHAFSPGSIVLASYIYQDKDIRFHSGVDPISFVNFADIDRAEQAHSIEGQYLYRSPALGGFLESLNLTTGVGHFRIKSNEIATLEFDLPPPPDGPGPIVETFPLDLEVRHSNLYGYSTLNLPRRFAVTVGVSGDFFNEEGGIGERNQANPKLGLTWNPWPKTTLRGAGFRVLKRTLVTDQTLEPTQIAGFNQFFDDASGTESWVYGGAVDQKLGSRVFGGAELSSRDLKVPVSVLSGEGDLLLERVERDERMARAYLFATPHQWLALSAEYQYERFRNDPVLGTEFEKVTTHRVPLGASFIHPSGMTAGLRMTYLDQSGLFYSQETVEYLPGSRDFTVVDAFVQYRIPKRYGLLSFGVNNLTNQESTYQATDPKNLNIRPGRAFFGRVTLNLP